MTVAARTTPAPDLFGLVLEAASWRLSVLAIIAVGGIVVLTRMLYGMGQRQRASMPSWRGRMSDQKGTATIEFVLVLPVLIVLVLLLIQTMLMMVGNVFVHYAAYAAARVAVVQIPRDLSESGDGDVNFIRAEEGNEKFDRIQSAAASAVMPVSGPLGGNSVEATRLRTGLQAYFRAYEVSPPNWVSRLAPKRMDYAIEHTRVTLSKIDDTGDTVRFDELAPGEIAEFSPKEPIGVEVAHRLHLSIPYVGVIFADGTHDTADGPAGYSVIRATSMLSNEGFGTELPEPPPVPRRP